MTRVAVYSDARAAAPAVESVVGADPLGYTLLATVHGDVMNLAREYPDALWMVAYDDDDRPVGAAMRTPPYPVYLGPMPDEAAFLVTDALAGVLAAEGLNPARDVEGFNGAAEAARTAVSRWQRMFPQVSVTTTVPVRLHRLDHLVAPDVPGEPRVATAPDLRVVEPWHLGFAADVGHPVSSMDDTMRLRMRRRSLLLWTVDGDPVSMAGHTPVAGGVTRIGPVYTPPEQRRHGYGAAVTAAASVAALAQPGAVEVTLFTDLRNPTSNKIYAEIGFRPVRDYLEIGLATGP